MLLLDENFVYQMECIIYKVSQSKTSIYSCMKRMWKNSTYTGTPAAGTGIAAGGAGAGAGASTGALLAKRYVKDSTLIQF